MQREREREKDRRERERERETEKEREGERVFNPENFDVSSFVHLSYLQLWDLNLNNSLIKRLLKFYIINVFFALLFNIQETFW